MSRITEAEHLHDLLPASLEAERGILACLRLDAPTVASLAVARGVSPECFTDPFHAQLFTLMMDRWAKGQTVSLNAVVLAIDNDREAQRAAEILCHTSHICLAEEYLEVLGKKHQVRQLIAETRRLHDAAWQPEAEPGEILASLAGLQSIAAPVVEEVSFKRLLVEKIDRLANGEPSQEIVRTGLAGLDRHSPLHLGDMPLISGARKGGKSILALTIAGNVLNDGYAVLYFSLEEPDYKVVDRLFAGAARLPMERNDTRDFSRQEQDRIHAAAQALAEKRIFIYDRYRELSQIVAVATQKKAQEPTLRLIVVDYAQLVQCRLGRNASREQEVAAVSRTLRQLSIELKIPILVLCQLNGEGDTRESKALEQDTTAMWRIYPALKPKGKKGRGRPEERGSEDGGEEDRGRRVIGIPFQRDRESNVCFPVAFLANIARIENLADEKDGAAYDDV